MGKEFFNRFSIVSFLPFAVCCILSTVCCLLFTTSSSAQGRKDQSKSLEAEADTLLNRQNFQEALHLYNKIIRKSKLKKDDDYKILYKRAFAFYGLGNHENALQDVNKFLEKFSGPEALLLRAYLYQELII